MRSISAVLLVAIFLSLGVASAPAKLATGFADVYSSFAPIFAFHEAYADYLFTGTEVVAPSGLAAACERFSIELGRLHALFLQQTGSVVVPVPATMVSLRAQSDGFCTSWQPTLEEMAASPSLDRHAVQAASDAGLFADIYALKRQLEDTFTAAFDAIDDDELRWRFAVTFAVRGLMNRDVIVRVATNLDEIFFGGPGRTDPPFSVPEEVVRAMQALIDASGRDIDEKESERIRALAARIHAYFQSGSRR